MASWEEVKRQRLNQNKTPSSSWEEVKRQRLGQTPERTQTPQSKTTAPETKIDPYASLIKSSMDSTRGVRKGFSDVAHWMNSAGEGLSHALGTDKPTTQSWLDDIQRLESGVAEDWDASQYNATIQRSPYAIEQEKRDRLSYVLGSDQDRFNYDINRSDTRFRNLDYVTDDQKRVLSYYVQNGDYDSASQYLDAIERDTNERAMARYKEHIQNTSDSLANSDNWLVREVGGDAYDMAVSLGGFYGSGLGAVATLEQVFDNAVTGNNDSVDPNSAYFRGTVASELGEQNLMKDKEGIRKVATEVVNNSLRQFLPARLMGGGSVNVLFGLASAGETAYENAKNGGNPVEGLIDSTVKGLISYESESRLSADDLFGLGGKDRFSLTKEGLKLLARNMMGEAYEEAEEAVLDAIWERAFLGGRSEYSQNVKRYIDAGMTEGEAEEQALLDFLKQTGYSMRIARLSAGVDTVGAGAVNDARINARLTNEENRNAVIEEGQAFTDKNSQAYKNAEALRLKQEQDGKISRREAVRQYRLNEAQTTEEFENSVREKYKELSPSNSDISMDVYNSLTKALRGEALSKSELQAMKDQTAQKVFNHFTNTDLNTFLSGNDLTADNIKATRKSNDQSLRSDLNQYRRDVQRSGIGESWFNTINRLKSGDASALRNLPQEIQNEIATTRVGESGAKSLRRILDRHTNDQTNKAESVVGMFNHYYVLGISGRTIVNFDNKVLPKSEAYRAYSAGLNDRDASLGRVNNNRITHQRAVVLSSDEAGFTYSEARKMKKSVRTAEGGKTEVTGGLSPEEVRQLDALAKKLGVKVITADRDSKALGGSNGTWFAETGVIVLASDLSYKEMVGQTYLHESLHRMMREAPREYRALASAVADSLGRESEVLRNYGVYNRDYSETKGDRKLSATQIFEEIVADFVGQNISLSDFERMLAYADNETLSRARKAFYNEFTAQELNASSLNRVTSAMYDVVRKSRQKIAVTSPSGDIVVEISGDVRNAYRSSEYDWGKNSLVYKQISKALLDAKVFETQEGVDALRRTIWDTMDYIKTLYDNGATWLDIDMAGEMTKENRISLPFKENSDPLYTISLDYSTLCKKRLMQQYIIDRLQEKLYDNGTGGVLTREQQLAVRKTLKVLQANVEELKSLEVACGLCFVESARLKSPKQANRLLKDKGGFVSYFFASGNDKVNAEVDKNTRALKRGFAVNKIDLNREGFLDEQKRVITAGKRTLEEIADSVIPYSTTNAKYFEKDRNGNLTGRMLDKNGNPITETTSNGKLPSSMKGFIDKSNKALRQAYGASTLTSQQKAIVDIANKLTDLHFSVSDNLLEMAKGKLPTNVRFTELNKEIEAICKDSGVTVKEAMQTIYTAYSRRITQSTKSKKLEQGTVYYWGDASTEVITQAMIDNFNRNTGLRHQSWSDFEVTHLLDTMTAIAELSARRVKMQAYTKVPNMIRILGNTGMMINSSLIPTEAGFKTVNGKKVLDFDNKEGMPIDIALNYRHNFSNTNGTICIGINAEHIRMLLATDVMDYVIPYHASGMPKSLQGLVGIHGWKDATLSQEEKIIDKKAKSNAENWHKTTDFGDWFNQEFLEQFKTDDEYNLGKIDRYIKKHVTDLVNRGILNKARIENYTSNMALDLDGNEYIMDNPVGTKLMRARALNYMNICSERGMRHKFTEYAQEGNYWKLLIDTKMVNNEGDIIIQQAVKPKFNFDNGQTLYTTEGDVWLDANGKPLTTSIKDFISEERADDVHKLWGDTTSAVMDVWLHTDIIDRFARLRTKDKGDDKSVDKSKDKTITDDLVRYARAHFKGKVNYDAISALPILARSADYTEKKMPKVKINDADIKATAEELEVSDTYARKSKATPNQIPKKTVIGYKVFIAKNGQLYPPKVANPSGAGTPVGVWLSANIGQIARNPDGSPVLTDTTGRFRVLAGQKGTDGRKGTLAFRSGWHLGEYPDAKQFAVEEGYDKDGNPLKVSGVRQFFPDNYVWAECEISADIDYQLDAMALGVDKKGKFHRTQAGLPYVPERGYYKYRTNPDEDTAPWYICGRMKVVRIIDDKEAREICARYGVENIPRQHPEDIVLADYGLNNKPITTEDYADPISEEQKRYEEEIMALLKMTKGYQKRKINFDDPEIQKEFRRNGQDVNEYRRIAEETGNSYLNDGNLYGGSKFPELPSYTFANISEVPEVLTNDVNAGFHAGDLGKAEYAGNMGGSRSTGHFGTGTYFVGDLDKLSGGSYGNRPVTAVDFRKYNLFTPETQEDAVLVHDFLKDINKGLVSKDLKKEWNRENSTRVQKILGIAKKTEMWNIIDGLDQDYSDWYGDSMSTRFMKALGYEGVDVRNLPNLDNTTYGSVIYDLKGNDLDRAKNFENKVGSRYSKASDARLTAEENRELQDIRDNYATVMEGTPRYSHVGIKGITAQGDADRLANYERSKMLYEKGVAIENIRKDTGWHMGADDKWRFEVDDSQSSVIDVAKLRKQGKLNSRLNVDQFIDDHPNLVKGIMGRENLDGYIKSDLNWSKASSYEKKRRNTFYNGLRVKSALDYDTLVSINKGEAFYLDEILSHDELYSIYPELRDVVVTFDLNGNSKYNGLTYTAYDHIKLNHTFLTGKATADLRKTLLHEVQHWVQENEEFAKGGNSGMFESADVQSNYTITVLRNERTDIYNELQRHLEKMGDKSLTEKVENVYREIKRRPRDFAKMRMSADEYASLSQEAKKKLYDDNQLIRSVEDKPSIGRLWAIVVKYDQMERARNGEDLISPYELYEDLAGEQEARDVSSRADLTEAERKELPPQYRTSDTIFSYGDKYEGIYTEYKGQNAPHEGKAVAEVEGDVRKSKAVDNEGNLLTKAQEEFFQYSKVRDANGNLMVMYHGTTRGGFNIFDRSFAQVGGNSGGGFYFSSSREDSEDNYVDIEGADNFFKWSQLRDQILEAGEWEGEPVEDEYMAEALAMDYYNQNPELYEVYLDIRNPYIRDWGRTTNVFQDLVDSWEEDKDSLVDRADFETDELYEEELINRRYGYYYENIFATVNAVLESIEEDYDYVRNEPTTDEVTTEIVDMLTDDQLRGVTFDYLESIIEDRTPEFTVFNEDWDNGAEVSAEFARRMVQESGFDGIIDREVTRKFNQVRRLGDPDIFHAIAFYPQQIKRVTNENPTYGNPDIRKSKTHIISEDGTDYGTGIIMDNTLLSGLTVEEQKEMVGMAVTSLAGQTLSARDQSGNEVPIRIPRSNEYFWNANGNKRRTLNELAKKGLNNPTKREILVHLDEILPTAQFDKNEPSYKSHGVLDNRGTNPWGKWNVRVVDKNGDIFTAVFSVPTNAHGEQIWYSLDTVVDTGKKISGVAVKSANTSATNSVPSPEDSVNRKSKRVGTDLSNRGIYENVSYENGKRTVGFTGEKRVQSTKVENFARALAKDYGNGVSIRSVYNDILSLYNREINRGNTNELIDLWGEASEIADKIADGDKNLADALTNLIIDNYYGTPRARKSDMDKFNEEFKRMEKTVTAFNRLSFREKIKQIRKDNKNLNTILDIARTFKEWGKGERNRSEFADPVIKGFANALSKVKRSSDISRTKARGLVANLKPWYTEDNLGDYYNQAVADRIDYIYQRKDSTKYPDSTELQYIADVMKAIRKLYKTYDQMTLDGKKVSIRETATNEYHVLERSPYSEVRIRMLNKVSDNISYAVNRNINNIINNIIEPRVVYGSIEGFAEDGLLMKLFNETTDAETRMNAMYINMTRVFDEFFAEHKGYKKHYATDRITIAGEEMSVGEAISLYWTANREEAKATLMSDKVGSGIVWQVNGVTKRIQNIPEIASFRRVLWNRFTEEDKELRKLVHKFFTETATDIKLEADDRILGFTNISGDRSDYFPFVRDKDQIGKKYADAKSLMRDVTSAYNYSFNKDIKQNVTLALQLIPVDQMWKDHARKMSMYSCMTEILQTWDKVLNCNLAVDENGKKIGQESLRGILQQKWRDFSKYHSHFMQDVQNKGRGESNPMANFVRGAYATSQLGFNAKVILSQTASYPTALMYLDAESMAEAVTMKTDFEALDKYSPYAMARAYDNGIVLSEGNITSTLGEIGNFTTKPIAQMDRLTIGWIWNACQIYVKNHQGLRIGTEENYRERAKLHEQICRRTQPNYTQTERSGMMRSGNEIVKSFTMFTSVPLKQLSRMVETGTKWRMANEEYKRTKSESSKAKLDRAKAEFFKCQMACLLANAMYVILATGVRFLLPRKDDDQEITAQRYGKEVFDVYMGLVPVWKDLYGYFANGYEVSNYFYSSVNDMLETIKKMKDIGDDPFGTMWSLTQQMAMFSGLPVRNVKNAFIGVMNQMGNLAGGSVSYEIAKKQKSIRNTSNKNYFVQYIYEALYNGDAQSASYIIQDMKSRGYTDKDIESALKTIFANEAYEAWNKSDQRELTKILNALGSLGWNESVIDSKVQSLMKKDLTKERDIKSIAEKLKRYNSTGRGNATSINNELSRVIQKYTRQGYTQETVESAISSLM